MICLRLIIFSSLTAATTLGSPLEKAAKKHLSGTIPLITSEQLVSGEQIILLDTRSKEEFAVSHISKAIWIGYKNFALQSVKKIPKNAEIVVYCSIGYRSEKIGEKLNLAGYNNVRNLKGGIFHWANQSLPLIDQTGKVTKKVHGYNKKWSKLLAPNVPVTLAK